MKNEKMTMDTDYEEIVLYLEECDIKMRKKIFNKLLKILKEMNVNVEYVTFS